MWRCPRCRAWIGPFRRAQLLQPDHTMTCPSCMAELCTTSIGALVFGCIGFGVGLALALVVWLLAHEHVTERFEGRVWAVVVGLPFSCAAIGVKFCNPLEVVPPKTPPRPRSLV